jgi:hypothetical protein
LISHSLPIRQPDRSFWRGQAGLFFIVSRFAGSTLRFDIPCFFPFLKAGISISIQVLVGVILFYHTQRIYDALVSSSPNLLQIILFGAANLLLRTIM